jgi:Second Messenger Oligonucleotide or Dinucleotide Synthetase domain/Adenylyl/Guanylyl and SMODS C-terminal sensor domain
MEEGGVVKLVSLFDDFLKDTVNLNQSRIDLLDDSVSAMKDFIRQSEWKPKIRGFEEQGSWAHKTIIKPVAGGEFDADLLVMIDPVEGWTAADYVTSLGKVFADSTTYAAKAKTWDYCVTINYASERKIDIAPCVKDRSWTGNLEVCNRAKNQFERSEPVQYTDWLKERNTYSGSNSFRKVTRLLKYLRDIKLTFTCSSVLLTTLLGYRIEWFDKDTDGFVDTPTTLRTVMGRLDDWLQARPAKPSVLNPKLTTEDFATAWTDTQYTNFRNFINKYRGWIDEAYLAEGRADSIELWQKVFGDEFAKGEVLAKAAQDSALMAMRSGFLSSTAAHLSSIVDAVKSFGLSVLPSNFYRPPHLQEPPWRIEGTPTNQVHVSASWHAGKESNGRAISSGEPLPRNGGLWFDVTVNTFQPLPAGYSVQWRVTNTGEVALGRNAGRGDFYTPMRGNRRWEELQYRGVHFVEAFIIRMRDEVVVGISPPFSVVIE